MLSRILAAASFALALSGILGHILTAAFGGTHTWPNFLCAFACYCIVMLVVLVLFDQESQRVGPEKLPVGTKIISYSIANGQIVNKQEQEFVQPEEAEAALSTILDEALSRPQLEPEDVPAEEERPHATSREDSKSLSGHAGQDGKNSS